MPSDEPPASSSAPPTGDDDASVIRRPGGAPDGSGGRPTWGIFTTALVVLAAGTLALVFSVVVVSGFQHSAAQHREFDRLRGELAGGTAPLGPTDSNGRLLAAGTPVGLLQIPSIGVHEVVLEGTTSAVTESGPGHLRDTVLPGQVGASVVFGREAAYGGPFKRIQNLRKGDTVISTIGQGRVTFKVIAVLHAGDRVPPPLASGKARLTLLTASGMPFLPGGVVRVVADSTGPGLPAATPVLNRVPRSELALGTDTSSVWELVLWLEALVLVVVGAVWALRRWGPAQAFIVFIPLVLVIGLAISNQVTRLLPNLM
jgi:LPXTG-site transpeptidase (sortase) family protein